MKTDYTVKPCPFCGNEARVIKKQSSAMVCCNTCGASTTGRDREQALARWNNRTADAKIAELEAELKEAVFDYKRLNTDYEQLRAYAGRRLSEMYGRQGVV